MNYRLTTSRARSTRVHSARAKSGFTLVELLVVIGIIALLSAIIFPVFGRVRENGRRTACASNMKQLGLALSQYMNDNAGRFPFAANYQDWQSPAAWITGGKNGAITNDPLIQDSANNFAVIPGNAAYPDKGSLYQYVKDANVYLCPSDVDGKEKKVSYSMNCALSYMGQTRVKTPGEIVFLVDEGRTLNDGYFWAVNDPASTDALTTKHLGGGNLLFVDGHVKFFNTESFRIDESPQGIANKAKMDGSPRFHDRAFGPKGSFFRSNPFAPAATKDVCGVDINAATPPTPPTP